MALVHYDASDVSDEDESEEQSSSNKQVLTQSITRNVEEKKAFEEQPVETISSKLGLPTPKHLDKELEENDLEDIVKPKDAELALREKPPAHVPQKTRIVIPSLPSYDSDDEEGPSAKKVKRTGGHGLFDLLPAPKGAISNTSLVPQNVAKKAKAESAATTLTTSKPSLPPEKLLTPAASHRLVEEPESDDSDNEQAENFFMLGASNSASKLMPSVLPSTIDSDLKSVGQGTTSLFAQSSAPLQFRSMGPTISWPAPVGVSADVANDSDDDENDDDDDDTEEQFVQTAQVGFSSSLDNADAEQLLRLQGKRNWGREAMHIVDVRADDHLDPTSLVKSLTEETSTVSHSKKNKDQLPSVQKRKHQITWLAHKAKEQELELKQQWADNRMTKKQTQSKYGF